jgi:hypothetical protein
MDEQQEALRSDIWRNAQAVHRCIAPLGYGFMPAMLSIADERTALVTAKVLVRPRLEHSKATGFTPYDIRKDPTCLEGFDTVVVEDECVSGVKTLDALKTATKGKNLVWVLRAPDQSMNQPILTRRV